MQTLMLLSDDLIFTSKIVATAKAYGMQVATAKSWVQLRDHSVLADAYGLILDLHHPDLNLLEYQGWQAERKATLRTVGYGSHVDSARLKAARMAGVHLVLPRSKFVTDLETKLLTWFDPNSSEHDTNEGEDHAVHEDARPG